VDDHRRKWDRSEFEKLARERLAAEEKEVKSSSSRDTGRHEPTVKRDLLKPRDYKVIFILLYFADMRMQNPDFLQDFEFDFDISV